MFLLPQTHFSVKKIQRNFSFVVMQSNDSKIESDLLQSAQETGRVSEIIQCWKLHSTGQIKTGALIRIFSFLIRKIFISHFYFTVSTVTRKKVIKRPQNQFFLGTCIFILQLTLADGAECKYSRHRAVFHHHPHHPEFCGQG